MWNIIYLNCGERWKVIHLHFTNEQRDQLPVGRALHRCRRGHEFKLFSGFNFTTAFKSCVYNCDHHSDDFKSRLLWNCQKSNISLEIKSLQLFLCSIIQSISLLQDLSSPSAAAKASESFFQKQNQTNTWNRIMQYLDKYSLENAGIKTLQPFFRVPN